MVSFPASRLETCFIAIIFATAALIGASELFTGLTNDTNTLLHYSLYLLRDGGMYTRWLEVNPPMIMLIYTLPAGAILWLGAAPAVALHGFTLICCIGSLLITRRALAAHTIDAREVRLWLTANAFALLVAPLLCNVFGDREHFLFIFAGPWIIQMLLGVESKRSAALLAAIGFWIKPYNIIIAGALLLLAGPQHKQFLQRVFSPSAWIIGVVGVIYAAIVFLCFPHYAADMVPLGLATYQFIANPAAFKLMYAACVLTPTLALFSTLHFTQPPIRRAWMGLLVAGFLDYYLNGGWQYTLYLIVWPASLILFLSFSQLILRLRGPMIGAALLIFLTVAGSIWQVAVNLDYTRRTGFNEGFHQLPDGMYDELRAAAGERFVLLATSLWGTNIAGYVSPPHHVFAYDYLWPLPWLYANLNDAKAPNVAHAMTQPLAEALALRPAPTLIVDESPRHRGFAGAMDFVGFFMKFPETTAPLSEYKLVKTIDHCDEKRKIRCKYTIWKRSTP